MRLHRSTGAHLLLYVYPSEQIVALIAYSKSCQKPGYAEFRWINGEWVVQQNLNPLLIGLSLGDRCVYLCRKTSSPAARIDPAVLLRVVSECRLSRAYHQGMLRSW